MKSQRFPVLLALWPYCLIALFIFTALSVDQSFSQPLAYCFMAGLLASPVLGIVSLILGSRDKEADVGHLCKWALRIKLIHIPFYLFMIFLCICIPIGIVFFFIADVMILCSSAGFAIASVIRARREGILSTVQTVIFVILNCFFITDVISAVLVRRRFTTT